MNKSNLKVFKDECLRLQAVWGLTNWRIDVHDKKMEDIAAEIHIMLEDRVVKINFDSSSVDDITDIEVHAKHEMIHLIFARLYYFANKRFANQEDVYEANEEVVRVLEKLL